MDTLFAGASEGLAKAATNRRGFLSRLVRATTGAVVLTAGLATVARADHCEGSHRCLGRCYTERTCGGRCRWTGPVGRWRTYAEFWEVCWEVNCYTRKICGGQVRSFSGCGIPGCN